MQFKVQRGLAKAGREGKLRAQQSFSISSLFTPSHKFQFLASGALHKERTKTGIRAQKELAGLPYAYRSRARKWNRGGLRRQELCKKETIKAGIF